MEQRHRRQDHEQRRRRQVGEQEPGHPQEEQLHEINRNTKKIIAFFDSAALKKQAKSKKWNLKKEEDLTAALSYYDQRLEKKKDN